jgi:uncharacterized damage-inducible protein DinB
MSNVLASHFLKELEKENPTTGKCLERIPESLFGYKPHPKSMELGYLSQLVAAIPLWIKHMIEDGEIDLVTFPRPQINTTQDLVNYYQQNIEAARQALQHLQDDVLQEPFSLKANGKTMYTITKGEDVMTTLNHWVHHRGQLTVYMRLNDIEVPSIYGPSADDKSF